MTSIDINESLAQIVALNPRRARVFEKHGVDYWCRGERSLRAACEERGLLDTFAVVEELRQCDDGQSDSAPSRSQHPCVEWRGVPPAELVNHITSYHHEIFRTSLADLLQLADKATEEAKLDKEDVRDLRDVIASLKHELLSYIADQEKFLFPRIKNADSGKSTSNWTQSMREKSSSIKAQHAAFARTLRILRKLSNDYRAPESAPPSRRKLLSGLAELELDLHMYIHEENNILLPALIEDACATA